MKRLYRNPEDQMIAGVCSGIAEYVNVDPTAVRLVFLLLLFVGGGGLLVYLIMWAIMPVKPGTGQGVVDVAEKKPVKKVEKPAVKVEKKAPVAAPKKTTTRKSTTTKKTDTK
jgi:phage shock protein C